MTDTTLSMDTSVSGYRISAGDRLIFDPAQNVTLTVNVNYSNTTQPANNIIVQGTFRMHPNAGKIHKVVFSGINNASIIGGTVPDMANPFTTDAGIWVVDSGVLDWVGQTKTPWNRTGTDATWQVGDEIRSVPWNGAGTSVDLSTYAVFVPGTDTPQTYVTPDGVTQTQEIVNLTRNVRVEGTSSGRAHIMIMSDQPQTIDYVAGRYLGFTASALVDGHPTETVVGRYGVHYHKVDDASRSSIDRGIVLRDGGRAFVHHHSNGIHWDHCLSYLNDHEAFWYDPNDDATFDGQNAPDDLTIDSCGAMYDGTVQINAAFIHETVITNNNNEVKNNFVVGAFTNGENGCYKWPATKDNQTVWNWHDNVAHNIDAKGIFIWQNDPAQHQARGFTCFKVKQGNQINDAAGGSSGAVDVGAYRNDWDFVDCVFDDAFASEAVSSGAGADVDHGIQSYRGQTYLRCHFDALLIARGPLTDHPQPGSRQFIDCTFHSTVILRPGQKWFPNFQPGDKSGSGQIYVDFVRSNLDPNTPASFANLSWDQVNAHSVIRFQNADGSAWQMDASDTTYPYTFNSISQFYFDSGATGTGGFAAVAASLAGTGTGAVVTGGLGHVQGQAASFSSVGSVDAPATTGFISTGGGAAMRIRDRRLHGRLRGGTRLRAIGGPAYRHAIRARGDRRIGINDELPPGRNRVRGKRFPVSLRHRTTFVAISVQGGVATSPASFAGLGAVASALGPGALTGAAASFAGTGTETIPASGGITGTAASFAGTGAETNSSVGQFTGAKASFAGTSTISVTAAGGVTPAAASFASTGQQVVPTASGGITGAAASLAGTGTEFSVYGSSAFAPAAASFAATGFYFDPNAVAGLGNLAAPAASFAGTGVAGITGTGNLTGAAASFGSTGTETITGTSAFAPAAASFDGDGSELVATGVGAVLGGIPSFSALGTEVVANGSGNFQAAAASLRGGLQTADNTDYETEGPFTKWHLRIGTLNRS